MGNVCGGESGAPPPDKAEFAQFESSYSPPLEVNDANQKVFFEISIGGTMIGVRLCCCCGFCRLYPARPDSPPTHFTSLLSPLCRSVTSLN